MPISKGKDCVGNEMERFHKGALHSGKGDKVVTDPKQAKAIALSACGESKYSETLQSIGFSAETAEAVVEMFSESFLKKSKSSVSSSSFDEVDWGKQFQTGKGPGPEKPENYHTGLSKKKVRGQLQISDTGAKGDLGKRKVNNDAEMLSPVAYPKGPGNPQGGSSKEVFGMRALG
jgi:hypothetical protein